jgi:hypothetical protein
MMSPSRCGRMVIALAMMCILTGASTPGASASHVTVESSSMVVSVDQPSGVMFTDAVNLSGTSTQPLRNTSWTIVNISGSTPITVLSGPYLTSVVPLADGVYRWTLLVDLQGVDCTCYVELSTIDEQHRPFSVHHVVYVGDDHQRPVLGVDNPQSYNTPHLSGEPFMLQPSTTVELKLIQPSLDSNNISVFGQLCEAPFEVCLGTPFSVSIPHRLNNQSLYLDLDANQLALNEGIWRLTVHVTDELLRSSHRISLPLVHDTTPPETSLNVPVLAQEGEVFLVFAEVDDGYEGSISTLTWFVVDNEGVTRSPTVAERLSEHQLSLNLTRAGTYTLELTVRDHAGNTARVSEQVMVENLKPIARISVDGLTVAPSNTVKLGPGDNWSLSGTMSQDNEPIEYLWVINEATSIRGVPSLTQTDFSGTGLHTVELIVFDDDGATDAQVIEVMILKPPQEEVAATSPLAMTVLGLLILVALAALPFIKRQRPTESDLPRWQPSAKADAMFAASRAGFDATVEEDEP